MNVVIHLLYVIMTKFLPTCQFEKFGTVLAYWVCSECRITANKVNNVEQLKIKAKNYEHQTIG